VSWPGRVGPLAGLPGGLHGPGAPLPGRWAGPCRPCSVCPAGGTGLPRRWDPVRVTMRAGATWGRAARFDAPNVRCGVRPLPGGLVRAPAGPGGPGGRAIMLRGTHE
jgi:hypothetical protein